MSDEYVLLFKINNTYFYFDNSRQINSLCKSRSSPAFDCRNKRGACERNRKEVLSSYLDGLPCPNPRLSKVSSAAAFRESPQGLAETILPPPGKSPGAALLLRVASSALFQTGKLAHILLGPRCLSSLEHPRRDWVTQHQGIGEALPKCPCDRAHRPASETARYWTDCRSSLQAPEPAQTPPTPWGASPSWADPAAPFLRELRVGR